MLNNLINSPVNEEIAKLADLIDPEGDGTAQNAVSTLDYATMAQTVTLILFIENLKPVQAGQSAGDAIVAALEAVLNGGDPTTYVSFDTDTIENNIDLQTFFRCSRFE